METLKQSLTDLRAIATAPPGPRWNWQVRQQLSVVREALLVEPTGVSDAWLVAREDTVCRDRDRLVVRVHDLGWAILRDRDAGGRAGEVRRLTFDLEHHAQRVSDLLYDSVSLELGGSD